MPLDGNEDKFKIVFEVPEIGLALTQGEDDVENGPKFEEREIIMCHTIRLMVNKTDLEDFEENEKEFESEDYSDKVYDVYVSFEKDERSNMDQFRQFVHKIKDDMCELG